MSSLTPKSGEDSRRYTVQLIPLGVTFSNAVSKLKAQSSNVSFHRIVAKKTLEL